jgi:hypothetical protein
MAFVRRFFEAANGTRPSVDDTANDYKLSETAKKNLKAEFTNSLNRKLDALLNMFLKEDTIRSQVLRDDQARVTFLPDRANDLENVKKIRENLQTLMLDHLAKLVIGQMYGAILQSTSRALVLRALQTGLKHADCNMEAFRFLRDLSLQLSALPTSLKEIKTNITKGPNGGSARKSGGNGSYHINAMGQFVPY